MPHATRLAAAFEEEFGVTSEFLPGGGGILEVVLDGNVVWTNRENRGYKPSNEEAISALRPYFS